MKYSQVKRRDMWATTDVGETPQEMVPGQIAGVLNDMIDQAKKRYAATIDWSTLKIEPDEPVFVITTGGERSRLPSSLSISVESIEIITGTIQEEKSFTASGGWCAPSEQRDVEIDMVEGP